MCPPDDDDREVVDVADVIHVELSMTGALRGTCPVWLGQVGPQTNNNTTTISVSMPLTNSGGLSRIVWTGPGTLSNVSFS